MSHIRAQRDASPQPTLIDVMIVLVICSAVTIFVFWIASRFMRLELFDQLPNWVVGTYGYFTALGTGSAGLGAAVIHSLVRRDPAPDYVRLIGVCLIAIFLMIVAIILIDRYLVVKSSNDVAAASHPPASPASAPAAPPAATIKPIVRNFSHPNVTLNGTMREIGVSVIDSGNGKGTYNISFKWTGSGGTQHGSQNATVTFKGAGNASLQSVVIPINRDHCYYDGGNLQSKNGDFVVDPGLVTGIEVTLSEVSGRMGVC
ncbi:hypothetical protein ABIE71_000299 [Bradyrhizobium diazoefficiens]